MKPTLKQKTTNILLSLDKTIRDTSDALPDISDNSMKLARLHGALMDANDNIRKILAMSNND